MKSHHAFLLHLFIGRASFSLGLPQFSESQPPFVVQSIITTTNIQGQLMQASEYITKNAQGFLSSELTSTNSSRGFTSLKPFPSRFPTSLRNGTSIVDSTVSSSFQLATNVTSTAISTANNDRSTTLSPSATTAVDTRSTSSTTHPISNDGSSSSSSTSIANASPRSRTSNGVPETPPPSASTNASPSSTESGRSTLALGSISFASQTTTETGPFSTTTTSIPDLIANSATTTSLDGSSGPTVLPIFWCGLLAIHCGGGGGDHQGIIIFPIPPLPPIGGVIPPPPGFPEISIGPDGKPTEKPDNRPTEQSPKSDTSLTSQGSSNRLTTSPVSSTSTTSAKSETANQTFTLPTDLIYDLYTIDAADLDSIADEIAAYQATAASQMGSSSATMSSTSPLSASSETRSTPASSETATPLVICQDDGQATFKVSNVKAHLDEYCSQFDGTPFPEITANSSALREFYDNGDGIWIEFWANIKTNDDKCKVGEVKFSKEECNTAMNAALAKCGDESKDSTHGGNAEPYKCANWGFIGNNNPPPSATPTSDGIPPPASSGIPPPTSSSATVNTNQGILTCNPRHDIGPQFYMTLSDAQKAIDIFCSRAQGILGNENIQAIAWPPLTADADQISVSATWVAAANCPVTDLSDKATKKTCEDRLGIPLNECDTTKTSDSPFWKGGGKFIRDCVEWQIGVMQS